MVAAGATAKSGSGGKWLLIGAMGLMLIVAVSAAGLYLAVPMLKDAPFLRDTPFFKNASLLEDESDTTDVADESAANDAGASSAGTADSGARAGGEGRFETTIPSDGAADAGESGASDSTIAQGESSAPGTVGRRRTRCRRTRAGSTGALRVPAERGEQRADE